MPIRILFASSFALLFVACATNDVRPGPKPDSATTTSLPDSKPATDDTPPLPKAPQSPILVQPQLWVRGKEPTFNGTAFFAKVGPKTFAITSAHFFEFDGAPLERVAFWDIGEADAPIASASHSFGIPGNACVRGDLMELRDDYVLMPLENAPQGYQVLELDPRVMPIVGEKIWFPNKTDEAEAGYVRVDGVVIEADPGFVRVKLNAPITLQSQSGSPILSVQSGKVIGTLSSGNDDGELTLAPMSDLLRIARGGGPEYSLPKVVVAGARSAKEKVSFQFGWPMEKPIGIFRRLEKWSDQKLTTRVAVARNKTLSRDGDRILVVTDGYSFGPKGPNPGTPEYVKTVAEIKDAFLPIWVDSKGTFIQVDLENDDASSPAAIKMRSIKRAYTQSRWGALVESWSGEEYETWMEYESTSEQPFGSTNVKFVTTFSMHHSAPCNVLDIESCIVIDTRTHPDVEDLKRATLDLVGSFRTGKFPNIKPGLGRMSVSSRSRLVTNPKTLLPLYLRTEQMGTIAANVKVGEETTSKTETFYTLTEDFYTPQ